MRRKYRDRKPLHTVDGILELASSIALETENVSDKIFGDKNLDGEERLAKLLEYPIPSELEWESDVDGQPYPLPLFIRKVIPFIRTREWLENRLSSMAKAESDRFIASIQISRRPALQAV